MRRNGLIAVGVLVFLGLAFFMFRDDLAGWTREPPAPPDSLRKEEPAEPRPVVTKPDPVEAPTPAPLPPAPATPEPAQEEIEVAALEESDGFVRERLEAFGLPSEWTSQDDLIRRLAVLTDGITRGDWPRRPIAFLTAPGRFSVIDRDGRLYADPRNAARFEDHLDLLESIDPASAARFLELVGPLMNAALRELGSMQTARDSMLEAIDAVLATAISAKEYELVQPKVLYEYADPSIEALAPFEKQLLRLGPSGVARLKSYLTRVRRELARPKS